ncbi:hypothetical protein RJ641_031547 [Dillenia turbinata]|uniref:Uncharacterized protein n=1 Tax=Dillenia turbinata TaxID=194707 RepID=A0AAN8ZEP7_9MAGN
MEVKKRPGIGNKSVNPIELIQIAFRIRSYLLLRVLIISSATGFSNHRSRRFKFFQLPISSIASVRFPVSSPEVPCSTAEIPSIIITPQFPVTTHSITSLRSIAVDSSSLTVAPSPTFVRHQFLRLQSLTSPLTSSTPALFNFAIESVFVQSSSPPASVFSAFTSTRFRHRLLRFVFSVSTFRFCFGSISLPSVFIIFITVAVPFVTSVRFSRRLIPATIAAT